MPVRPVMFVPFEMVRFPPLTPDQRDKLEAHKQHLRDLPLPPDTYDLLNFQTSVKDQNPRGSCATFAWVSAMEAFYKREYGLDLDLSEEYAIHRVWSVQHTKKPETHHENLVSDSGGDGWNDFTDGSIINNIEQPGIPEEKYAPYFGWGYESIISYGTAHSWDAFRQKQAGVGILDQVPNGPIDGYDIHKDGNGDIDITQKAVDGFEYDPWRITFNARKNAIYGAIQQSFGSGDCTEDFLEKHIAGNQEVVVGFNLTKEVKIVIKNIVRHKTLNFLIDSGNTVYISGIWINILDYRKDGSGGIPASGSHAALLVGYDRPNQRFIFKNSWGNLFPFFSVPYDYIFEHNNGGQYVESVRDPSLGPDREAMWLGKWNMDYDGVFRNIGYPQNQRSSPRPRNNCTFRNVLYFGGDCT